MSKSQFKRAAATARRMRFLSARLAALMIAVILAGALAAALSATPRGASANDGSGAGGDPGNGIMLANGGSGSGGDPGNEIIMR